LDIQNTITDIRNCFLDIQNNYFGYLKKRLNDNSACHNFPYKGFWSKKFLQARCPSCCPTHGVKALQETHSKTHQKYKTQQNSKIQDQLFYSILANNVQIDVFKSYNAERFLCRTCTICIATYRHNYHHGHSCGVVMWWLEHRTRDKEVVDLTCSCLLSHRDSSSHVCYVSSINLIPAKEEWCSAALNVTIMIVNLT